MQVKRMIWLYNHISLMKSEVNIIRELGYEVYIPKKPPFDVSIDVDWESDKRLSIPEETIERLNEVDFYESLISYDVIRILNENFDAVIFGPYIELVKALVLGFKGILIFHPFGLEKGMTYTKIFQEIGGNWLMLATEKLGKRFWFGQAYENLREIECDYFFNHAVDLPIGILNTEIDTSWTGKKKEILFICPRIKVNSYYEGVYKTFLKDFKGIPYSIGGVQPITDQMDKNLLGYLPQNEYDSLYYDFSVMFYHSRELYHIHYHPFEAVKKGMPLIFMGGGLLDYLGGKNLPGRAETIVEARKKCKRIIDGDIKFIEKVRNSQKILLEPMKYEFCKNKWIESFACIESESRVKIQADREKIKKVAVILPLGYRGGVLDYTIRLLTALKKGIKKNSALIELVFAYPDEELYRSNNYFESIRNLNIPIRVYSWENFTRQRLETTLQLKGHSYKGLYGDRILPNDGISYFTDCDFLLFTSDHVPGYPEILMPYGVILHDYIQRYLPEVLSPLSQQFINFARSSMVCYTTTECTKKDAVNYAGILENKIQLLPLFFEEVICENQDSDIVEKKESYFVWSTNTSMHKNHITALRALKQYYQRGGLLKCYVTGSNTEKFLNKDSSNTKYIEEVRNIIMEDEVLTKNIKILGYLSKSVFYKVLSKAVFFFHPGFADNGNGTAFDAAMLGVPSISCDYPAMRNMDVKCGLGIKFFSRDDKNDMANALIYAEEYKDDLCAGLPSLQELRKHTIQDEELCDKIYKIICGCIGA